MKLLETISYAELLSLWKRGLRNGSLRRMPGLKRGLFSAALEYARMTGVIVNQKLVEMVRAIAVRIGLGLGKRIFFDGLGRISSFLRNVRLMRIFAVVEKWINDYAYAFWLGTNMLVNKKSWLWV